MTQECVRMYNKNNENIEKMILYLNKVCLYLSFFTFKLLSNHEFNDSLRMFKSLLRGV